MIQNLTRREFQVACDGCGEKAASQATAQLALQSAQDSGWHTVSSLSGLAFLTTWFCPRCQGLREAQ